jgi:lipopolysaccharide transport system ATP-binding protein
VKGRIASLLEVGTGFHPDLTGRENIYLNGAILGMSRQEVRRKFDEIVDFAEIEQFIDTPVKRYSSGMYVRLAFAVAAHLEPEILLVDEVLAVGDAAFQNKCLGKMGDVARGGRTVLFVSHNLVAVSKLCKDCVWIDRGILREIGSTNTVVELYSRTALDQNKIAGGDLSKSLIKGDGRVRLLSYHVTNQLGQLDTLPKTNEDMFIHIRIFVTEPIQHPACGISIVNERGVLMTSINTVEQGISLGNFPTGEMEIVVQMRHVVFLPGSYTVSFWVMNPQYHIYVLAEDAINFEIGQSPIYGTRHIDHRWGCVYTDVTFIPNER